MGCGRICFGLFVIVVVILGKENEVKAFPMPIPDICYYKREHGHGHHQHTTAAATTAAPASEEPPKDERKEKVKEFAKLLEELLQTESDDAKKKEEEKKKVDEKKPEEPTGYASLSEMVNGYAQFLSLTYNYLNNYF